MPAADVVTDDMITRYQRDGVLLIKQALAPVWLDLMEVGVKRNMKNPGPYAETFFEGQPGAFLHDFGNYDVNPEYKILLQCSPIADIMRKLLRTEKLWLYYDQIFIKEGESRRTPWHQDTSYFIAEGSQISSAWITLETVSGDEALEFVLGSHLGPLYNATVFTTDEDTEWYKNSNMPPVPDIDAHREDWNIASWPVERGDILVLHPSILHGGGAMSAGGRRRAMSIRFFGEDVCYVERPGKPAPPYYGISEALKPGDPLRHPYFPLIRG